MAGTDLERAPKSQKPLYALRACEANEAVQWCWRGSRARRDEKLRLYVYVPTWVTLLAIGTQQGVVPVDDGTDRQGSCSPQW